MNTKPFRFAALCVAACLAFVLILYAFADKPNDQKNGFIRNNVQSLKLEKSVNLKYPAYYIAGISDQHIYFGNYSASLHVLAVNHHLTDTQSISLKISPSEKYAWKLARIIVDAPAVYMVEGTSPALYRGRLDDLQMTRFLPQSCYFNVLLNISPTSFISRSVQMDASGKPQNALVKIKTDSPYVKIASDAIIKQVDGIFCTDGTMDYDHNTGKILYLYHYRNEFVTLDSNLNVLYRGNTIDTNRVAKLQVANMSTGISKFSAPPSYVNSRVRLYNNKIFVLSALLADNEDRNTIKTNEIIDVYALADGRYLYSLHVPRYNKNRIYDFGIANGKLFALFDMHLCSYPLQEPK